MNVFDFLATAFPTLVTFATALGMAIISNRHASKVEDRRARAEATRANAVREQTKHDSSLVYAERISKVFYAEITQIKYALNDPSSSWQPYDETFSDSWLNLELSIANEIALIPEAEIREGLQIVLEAGRLAPKLNEKFLLPGFLLEDTVIHVLQCGHALTSCWMRGDQVDESIRKTIKELSIAILKYEESKQAARRITNENASDKRK